MKTIQNFILLLMICFWILNIDAQEKSKNIEPISKSFIKEFEIGDLGISRGVTVEETADGNYILTGYTTGNGTGGEDAFLIKTNSIGETLWTKIFGGSENDNGWAVRQTNDGGFIMVGFTSSFGAGGMDVYVLKTDANGEVFWTKTYGNQGDEFGWDIRTTSDNGFIIAAQTNSSGKGEIDAYLIKLDGDGNEVWSKTFGGDRIDRIFSVLETEAGEYVAAGITYSYNSIGPNDRDGYYIKTDSNGEVEWYKTFGKDGYDVGHSIAPNNDGSFMITGYGESYATNGNKDVYILKINSNGEILWTKAFGGEESERGIKGYQTSDGGYIVVGFIEGIWDVYLVKTDSEGELLWSRTFGEKNKKDVGYTVRETKDNGFIIIGHTENFDGSDAKILLIKTDSNGLVKKID